MRSRLIVPMGCAVSFLMFTAISPALAQERFDRHLRPAKRALPFPDLNGPTAKAAVADPNGDTFGGGAVDVSRFTAVVQGDRLDITIELSGDFSAPDSGMANALDGFIDLDVDQDGSTGDLSWTDFARTDGGSTGLGNEYYVDLFGWDSTAGTVEVWDDTTETVSGLASATLTASQLDVSIPLALIGGDDGLVDTAAIVGHFLDYSDLVPNDGSLSSDADGGGGGVLLQDDRFRVEVEWDAGGGDQGTARAAVVSDDSAVLYFFDPDNWEMLIKVLDGCDINDRFWVYFAATTDVGFTVTVTDTQTSQVAIYTNALGVAADAVTDSDAFSTCP